MKRRTFISLAGLTAALCLPSIAKAGQKPITGEVTATSSIIDSSLQLDSHESQFSGDWETVIKVIGIGGLGGKNIERMIGQGLRGVEFVVADTDARALKRSSAKSVIQLGQAGLSTPEPEDGFKAAMESRQEIAECLKGTHMVFIVAGMGGGSGMGGALVFAQVARELGILTVGLVTLPFGGKGKRFENASTGIVKLQPYIDSLIKFPNDRLIEVLDGAATMYEALVAVDDVWLKVVSGIVDMLRTQELVGLDFEDVRTVLSERGPGTMGIATANGVNRARVAAQKVIDSPLLAGVDLAGSQGMLVAMTASRGLRMKEVNEVMDIVREADPEDAHVAFGTSYDENMAGDLRIVLIATGDVGNSTIQRLVVERSGDQA